MKNILKKTLWLYILIPIYIQAQESNHYLYILHTEGQNQYKEQDSIHINFVYYYRIYGGRALQLCYSKDSQQFTIPLSELSSYDIKTIDELDKQLKLPAPKQGVKLDKHGKKRTHPIYSSIARERRQQMAYFKGFDKIYVVEKYPEKGIAKLYETHICDDKY